MNEKDDTVREQDQELEELWAQLEDVPMNPSTECLEQAFLHFPAGASREDIWNWFDEQHSKGVAYLMSSSCPEEAEEDLGYLYDPDEWEEEYPPSAYGGDYGPANPWDAPGMSFSDFI